MNKIYYILITVIFFSACAVLNKTSLSEEVLFTIDEDHILADEFLYVYEKNNFNNDSIYTSKDVDEYFDLFTNFKLKVAAAKGEGMDTTESFQSEFKTYKDQLIKPYLSEAKEQERLVKEAYERMKFEVDASHILVSVSQDALPEDTIKAYRKIAEVYKKALAGEPFEELAFAYSEDPSAKSNNGRLGYFSAFQMVFSFEDAAYKTPVDSISKILRSRFGYHIMKVHNKRPYSGKVKVSHIMLTLQPGQTDTLSVSNKIFEIHDQVMGGADWNELCQRYSQDQRTKNNGGTLPFIGLRQINDPSFEGVAFNLQEPGDISDPVRSRFGWHIIKLEEKQGLETFDEIKDDLEQKVSKDDRSRLSRKSVITHLKQENQFRLNEDVRDQFMLLADSALLEGRWDVTLDPLMKKDTIFSILNTSYLVGPLFAEIKSSQKRRSGLSPESYLNELVDSYIEEQLLDFEEKQLIESNRDFRMLLNEYFEGILLFEIMNQNVWGKAVEDTLGLQSYFHDHQEAYYWGKRLDAAIISISNRSMLDEVKQVVELPSYSLYKIEIDLLQEYDLLTDQRIDSLISLYDQYDDCQIRIYCGEKSMQSNLYTDLKRHLSNHGIENLQIIESKDEVLNNKIQLELNSISKKSLEYLYNKESALNLQVTEGLFEMGDHQLLDTVQWEKGIIEIGSENIHDIVLIRDVLEEQPKKLKDVKGLVISDYQNYLEKNWISDLRDQFTVNINKTTLDKIKKTYTKKLSTTD